MMAEGAGSWSNFPRLMSSAQAQTGKHMQAVEALGHAVDTGYSDVDYMEQDNDLAPLRELPAYLEIVTRLRATTP